MYLYYNRAQWYKMLKVMIFKCEFTIKRKLFKGLS